MKRAAIITAAVISIGALNLENARASDNSPATQPSHQMVSAGVAAVKTDPGGASITDVRIRSVIASATDAAMNPKGMPDLVSTFRDAQRQSIEKSKTYSEGFGSDLKMHIEAISKDWKKKYGDEFSISTATKIFSPSFAAIQTESPASNNGHRESALVTLRGETHLGGMQVPLICEQGSDWRIDAPAALDAVTLRANLLERLTSVQHNFANWPKSETDAYRLVAHEVMGAVLNRTMHVQASAAVPSETTAINSSAQQTSATVKPVSETTTTHHWYQFWNW